MVSRFKQVVHAYLWLFIVSHVYHTDTKCAKSIDLYQLRSCHEKSIFLLNLSITIQMIFAKLWQIIAFFMILFHVVPNCFSGLFCFRVLPRCNLSSFSEFNSNRKKVYLIIS